MKSSEARGPSERSERPTCFAAQKSPPVHCLAGIHLYLRDLDKFKVKLESGVCRDVVHPHGAVAVAGGDPDAEFIAFVHPDEGDLPAHDKVPDPEERRELLALGRVEDGSVDEAAGVVGIHDARRARMDRSPSLLQLLDYHSVVQHKEAFLLRLLDQKLLIGNLVRVVSSWFPF